MDKHNIAGRIVHSEFALVASFTPPLAWRVYSPKVPWYTEYW